MNKEENDTNSFIAGLPILDCKLLGSETMFVLFLLCRNMIVIMFYRDGSELIILGIFKQHLRGKMILNQDIDGHIGMYLEE